MLLSLLSIFFTRGIMLVVCILVGLGMIAFCAYCLIKKKHQKIALVISLVMFIIAVFVPLRMYVFKQSFIPQYAVENPSALYRQFWEMYSYGQKQRLVDKTLWDTNEYRSVYENAQTDSGLYLFCSVMYSEYGDDVTDAIKSSSAKSGEADGTKYWLSELKPSSLSWNSAVCCINGNVLFENNKGEFILVYFSIRNFRGANGIFPVYPKGFDDVSLLTKCDILK